MSKFQIFSALSLITALISSSSIMAAPTQSDSFIDALKDGKISFSARPRYESVRQDNALKDADAFTLRTTLGYETGKVKGFGAFIEFEDVSSFGADQYEEYPQTPIKQYSVVADPEGTEVNQAYLSYQGWDTVFKLGRQQITYRDAPFHRFIGNVLWRQNQQTYDAISLQNTRFTDARLSYAFINKVHSIFGEDLDAGFIDNGDIDIDAHLFNAQFSGLPVGNLEGYGYLLDYQDAQSVSSKTFGLRLSGDPALNSKWQLVYSLEYARQSDYKRGTMTGQNYYLTEFGTKYQGWMVKLSHEILAGDGTYSFNTPLGTNHAFQGWADQFLTTPAQGLKDTYLTLVGKVLWGSKLVISYHNFETDTDNLDAGKELDILLEKNFATHYTIGIKYADYQADDEFPALVDTEKFWVYGQVKF